MSQTLILWIVGAWFVIFLALGQSVSTVLFGSGLVGVTLWIGARVFDGIIGPDIFYTASIYSLSIVPLYLLMANLLVRGGVVIDLFRVGHKLAGYRRFPLGIATIITGGMLYTFLLAQGGASHGASLCGVAFTFAFRGLAIHFGWQMPKWLTLRH